LVDVAERHKGDVDDEWSYVDGMMGKGKLDKHFAGVL